MDHAQQPTEATGLPVQGPHLRLRAPDDAPGDFVPLRLFLQPSGAVVEINRPDMLIGRHTEADIRLPLPDVSRRHCQLHFTEGGWQVIDLNSLNGVHVNGEQVLQASLGQGDTIRIGGFTFTVDLSGQDRTVVKDGHVQSILKSLTNPPRRKAS